MPVSVLAVFGALVCAVATFVSFSLLTHPEPIVQIGAWAGIVIGGVCTIGACVVGVLSYRDER